MRFSLSSRAWFVLARIAGLMLVVLPFHAFLTVWASQFVGHYTVLRLWKELLLAILVAAGSFTVCRDTVMRRQLWRSWVVRTMVAYVGVQALWGGIAYITHGVDLTALEYGLISNCRFIIFFLVLLPIAVVTPHLKQHWRALIFWPLAVVVLVGLLQYFVLPYDVLKHFGYDRATIFPYEDINNNLHYIRIMSTLRGANPLGVYLAVSLCLLLAVWRTKRWWWYALLIGGMIALVLTFSRGAWLGFLAGGSVLAAARLPFRRYSRQLAIGAVMAIIGLLGCGIIAYNDVAFQNVVLHTQKNSIVQTTSDQGHVSALRQGLYDITHEPLGRGPGTAGPASVYNRGHAARIAENYFIQIGQETGWPGLGLFLGLIGFLGCLLWSRRSDMLALGLCAGLVAASVSGLFSHVWADDTLGYLWWGLAAIALAPVILKVQTKAEQIYDSPKDPSLL